jgi:6,7-dimethyl-8-ribityllumazine synthase
MHAGAGTGFSALPQRSGGGRRIAIVAARFNGEVVERLVDGATEALAAAGVSDDDVEVVWVPGAFELPLAARAAASSGRFDAVVALGAVIRGETAHFDFVAGEAARGLQDAALETGVPVSFGVLTTDTVEQAMDRAGGAFGNKGPDAAMAALEMIGIVEGFRARTIAD